MFYWIKPGGSVVAGSNLTIPSLSKNDHGTFTCHTGNSYGNNATKNLLLTVNCKCFDSFAGLKDILDPGPSKN
jgi:hypothetical protein